MHARSILLLMLVFVASAWAVGCERRPDEGAPSATVTRSETDSPAWITTKIQAQYFADPEIKPWNIDVTTTSGGHVTIRGEVDSAEDRATAVRIARQTDGVTEVEDLLRVTEQPAATSGRDAPRRARERDSALDDRLERPDLWITTKVQAKYFVDDEVRARNIDVDTRGGVVTLRGTVDSYAIRRQAVALARNTEGVREVRDELQVDTALAPEEQDAMAQIDDAWIATKIESKYFLDPDVKGRTIDVNVADGVVTLTGSVESDAQSKTAEQIAGETDGVTEVRNELQVAKATAQ
jgi:osmotically-inducible protein OsmY